MICYLVRHGKDDETIRGGWCNASLCEEGIMQVNQLSNALHHNQEFNISRIYSSDLKRTEETAIILANMLDVPVEFLPQFREVNNGLLAGMKNDIAAIQYPGLYWSSLGWEERYPDGESPKEFYQRIYRAWDNFKNEIRSFNENVLLVTHGGVMNVIQCIEYGRVYSNKSNPYPVGYSGIVEIEI